MVRLLRALYGHPASGGYWEQKCSEGFTAAGLSLVDEAFNSLVQQGERLPLNVVYVDDFKMARKLDQIKVLGKTLHNT